jgi:N-methylhydantoinase B/oxoprolinase/acetone carboxylase alpha subunit
MPNSSGEKDGVKYVDSNQGGMGGHAGKNGKSDAEFSAKNVSKEKKQK